MIVFLCPKPKDPSGGCWFIHRCVQLLNQAGREALVVQTEPYEVWWDANPIPPSMVTTLDKAPRHCDVLVVPEVLYPPSGAIAAERTICFVQNRAYLPEAYRDPKPETMVVSRYLYNWMKRVHGVASSRVTPFLDDGLWLDPNEIGHSKDANCVLVIARRNSYHEKLAAALEGAGFPYDYVTAPLDQRELAKFLARCEFYVHLAHPEGFPMACLEAMRAGTIVVGTTGGGGNEFMFHNETALCVMDPEVGRYGPDNFIAGIVEQLVRLHGDADLRSKLWTQAKNWSLRYTAQATTGQLLKVFGE